MLAVREAFNASRRAPLLSALGILTIGFSLFAFGLFALVAVNIREALRAVEQRVEVRAFVADGTPSEAVAAAMSDIGAFPEVAHVDFTTQEGALQRARKDLGEFSDVFEEATLPASIDIHLRPALRGPENVKAVADRVKSYQFVDDVRYGQEWVEKLYRLRGIAQAAGFGLGLAFAAVAVIIIGATIRVSVLAREKEISIMRLVGATDAFLRAPFLIDGFVKGILGALLALLLTWIAYRMIDTRFLKLVFFDSRLILAGILAGALIGVAGSATSVWRHLRRI
ncbi:MAG TPA: permease-like cell division protein FtsX [Gemmatimonadaceae bacterium]|nr:permease-like cell division protein FtsX [Gemmatimonadaceae bacterium]